MTIDGFAFYQIIIIFIALYNIFRGLFSFLNKKKSGREFVVSIFLWSIFGLLALYPNLSGYIANIFGFELGINALLVTITLILFFNMLKQSMKNDQIENTITRLVRVNALKDLES